MPPEHATQALMRAGCHAFVQAAKDWTPERRAQKVRLNENLRRLHGLLPDRAGEGNRRQGIRGSSPLMRIVPVGRDAGFDHQRHGEFEHRERRAFHYFFHQLGGAVGFVLRRFENEFVVDLQQ